MTAKITENPNFGTPLHASCLALESAEPEHTESLDLSCSLGPTSEKAGRVFGMCRWHVLRTVEFASEMFGGAFSPKIRFGFTKVFCPKISPTNSAANFAGKFRWQISPANFASKLRPANFAANFARQISPVNISPKDPRNRNMVVVLAVKFWVVVPESLRNTKECLSAWCVGGRAMRPDGKADGARLYLGPRRVTATKQDCPCCEQSDRTCTSQKDQGPQVRIYLQKNRISHKFLSADVPH